MPRPPYLPAMAHPYRDHVCSIATPHSAGTGFWWPAYGLVVTNEHLVRDDREVVLAAPGIPDQAAEVVYVDPYYDLAFLRPTVPPTTTLPLDVGASPADGDPVFSLSHPFGDPFRVTSGVVDGREQRANGVPLLRHTTALEPAHSGGPLFDAADRLIGVNTVLLSESGNRGLSLPVRYLTDALAAFAALAATEAVRCAHCATLVGYADDRLHCPTCTYPLPEFPSDLPPYEPDGIGRSVEELLADVGYLPALTRRGPYHWMVRRGSALIELAYYEKNGFLTGDAVLCALPPAEELAELQLFLLRENYHLDGLSFALRGGQVVLSFLIYDRYLHTDTGRALFDRLFDRADYYDDVLIERYGARPLAD